MAVKIIDMDDSVAAAIDRLIETRERTEPGLGDGDAAPKDLEKPRRQVPAREKTMLGVGLAVDPSPTVSAASAAPGRAVGTSPPDRTAAVRPRRGRSAPPPEPREGRLSAWARGSAIRERPASRSIWSPRNRRVSVRRRQRRSLTLRLHRRRLPRRPTMATSPKGPRSLPTRGYPRLRRLADARGAGGCCSCSWSRAASGATRFAIASCRYGTSPSRWSRDSSTDRGALPASVLGRVALGGMVLPRGLCTLPGPTLPGGA